jgi:6-phosphofructokinase
VFTTSTLAALFEDQGGGAYICRTATLGHMQQGGSPSGLDRITAAQLALAAVQFLESQVLFMFYLPNSVVIDFMELKLLQFLNLGGFVKIIPILF